MNPTNLAGSPLLVQPDSDLDGYESLADLALDLRLSWNKDNDEIWRRIEPKLWDATGNPWVVLHSVSREHLKGLVTDSLFRQLVDARLLANAKANESPSWFQQAHPNSGLKAVAYFSMEYMLSESLPIYSGGLGNVAGDQLKAASDLGVPVVGVGLLYQQGYFRQAIDKDGWQQELYPYNDPGQLPITPARTADGKWLQLEVVLPACSIWLRVWQAEVGGVTLYLLDTNNAANSPVHRGITSELYGGGPELRLQQEMVLGIGGWQLLEALGLEPDVCHLNEGHAAFAVLERARTFMAKSGLPFDAALTTTRAGNLFTTHTAVSAGFDRFAPALMQQYLGEYAGKLGITMDQLMAFGRSNPNDPDEPFNMAYLAIRGSGAVNGVSNLHGQVSRSLFTPLFPRWPEEDVPISSITNGIHVPTWISAASDETWTSASGDGFWDKTQAQLEQDFSRISDQQLWKLRSVGRRSLIDYVRTRLWKQLAASGGTPEALEEAKQVFDPDVLMIGFARRFAPYKRPNLLLHDQERLLRLLTDSKRPIQLILGGKAHPADRDGHILIQQWVQFLKRPEVRRHAVFLSDYDMQTTRQMVAGVDVWLNTPRRPWEACGTSGMKVLVNGGVNFSERDGWWAEAGSEEVGWSLGDGEEHHNDWRQDEIEAQTLYEQIEQCVIPDFYERDEADVPAGWIPRMRASMTRLTPQFSASRAVRQYAEQHYVPAALAYRERAAAQGELGKRILSWRQALESGWAGLRFGEVRFQTVDGCHLVEAEVHLNGIDPYAISVHLYANEIDEGKPSRTEMARGRALPQGFVYQASVPDVRPTQDYTACVVPFHADAAVPLECKLILWQR